MKAIPPAFTSFYTCACCVLALYLSACQPAPNRKAGPAAQPAAQPLPANGLRVYKPEKCYPGYTLFSHNPLGDVLFSPIYLIDMRGEVKHQWMPEIPAIHARLQPDGNLFYNTTSATRLRSRMDYGLYELDARSNVTWHLTGDIGHDFQVMDKDNFLIAENDGYHPEIKIVNRDKKVLWHWKGNDHLAELEQLTATKITLKPNWAHNNNASFLGDTPLGRRDPRFKKGNILFSFCELDTIGIIDYPSGRIVWAWGKGVIAKQHSPEMLDNGNILIFDNGERRSRVIEIEPLSGRIVWEYPGSGDRGFYSATISNATRLPNGNTLICDGNNARILEVTAEGETVWEFITPLNKFTRGASIYRAYRYSEAYAKPLFDSAMARSE